MIINEIAQQMLAAMENGTRVRRSRMNDKRIMGRRRIAIHVWTSRAFETYRKGKESIVEPLDNGHLGDRGRWP